MVMCQEVGMSHHFTEAVGPVSRFITQLGTDSLSLSLSIPLLLLSIHCAWLVCNLRPAGLPNMARGLTMLIFTDTQVLRCLLQRTTANLHT